MRSLQDKPDPVPPTLRDGEPRDALRSGVVPKPPASQPPILAGIVERSPRIIEALADAAAQHAAAGDRAEALRTIADAVDLLEDVRDRPQATRALVSIGETLALLGLVERAEPRLEEAVALADRAGETHLGARARHALGRVWLELGDPSCRGILEDAGEMFEAIGDGESAMQIDRLLRVAASRLELSPRSFHGVRR